MRVKGPYLGRGTRRLAVGDGVDLGYEAIHAPAAANDGVAMPENVVGQAKTRIGIGKTIGLAAERNAGVD